MFMRENRRKNGAKQPEQVAGADASQQHNARQLDPNDYPSQKSEDWRFSAKLSTPAAINDAHYHAGISSENGPYVDAYGQHIPFVGNKAPTGQDQELKG